MTVPRVKYGKLVGFGSNGYQSVIADDGEAFWLSPLFDAARGAKVGDRIKLEYQVRCNLALWWGSIADDEDK